IIFENITIIDKTEYENIIADLQKDINDKKDLPYLALALSSKAYGIWSHDPDFLEQKKVKILTNIDMLRLSGKIEKD
ncbi:MAG: PIN domain-containing protein, partial [Nanoarchaeota archaeon]